MWKTNYFACSLLRCAIDPIMAILGASVSDLLHMLQSHVMLLHQLAMLYAKTYGLAAHQLIAMVKTHMLLYDTPETISLKKW